MRRFLAPALLTMLAGSAMAQVDFNRPLAGSSGSMNTPLAVGDRILGTPLTDRRNIGFTVLGQGTQSPFERLFARVYREPNEWGLYWRKLQGVGPTDAIEVPQPVDFLRNDILVLHIGQRPTAGYSVRVDRILQVDSWASQVDFSIVAPPAGTLVAQVVTSPFVILRIPKLGGEFRFVGTEVAGFVPLHPGGCGCGCCPRPQAWNFGADGRLTPIGR